MSWKNTEPLDLWKTSTTLPIPDKRPDSQLMESSFGTAKTKFWRNLNEMGPKHRAKFFKDMISVWPYKWERRAVIWSLSSMPLTALVTGTYMTTKITADVFMINEKLGFFKTFLRTAGKPPIIVPPLLFILTHFSCYTLIYRPFVENEGNLTSKTLFWRAFWILNLIGVVTPLISVPPAANAAFYTHQRNLGMRPAPRGTVLDLLTHTYEATRSVWRKIPMFICANILIAGIATSALAWGRERIHDTMDLDPELIRTLMSEKEEKVEGIRATLRSIKKKFERVKITLENYVVAGSSSVRFSPPGDWREGSSKKDDKLMEDIFEESKEEMKRDAHRN